MITSFLDYRCKSTPIYVHQFRFVPIIKPKNSNELPLSPFHLTSNVNVNQIDDFGLKDNCFNSGSMNFLQKKSLTLVKDETDIEQVKKSSAINIYLNNGNGSSGTFTKKRRSIISFMASRGPSLRRVKTDSLGRRNKISIDLIEIKN